MDSMLQGEMKELVDELVIVKKTMKESDKGRHIDKLNEYIENQLSYYKNIINTYEDDRKVKWDELNEIFMRSIL